jgi:hypothetical protein
MRFHALRNEQSQNFWYIMTAEESGFYYNYDSPTILPWARDEIVPRVSPTIGSKKVRVTIFFTASRLLKVDDLGQG